MTTEQLTAAERFAARILERTSTHDDAEDAVLDLPVPGDVHDDVMARIDRAYGR